MKRQLLLILLALILGNLFICAQESDAIAISINGAPIYKSEIKEALQGKSTEETFDDFIQSFIDLKLNIEEAKAQQLDTTANYRRDYSAFKIQLGKKYKKDTTTIESVAKLIYERLNTDIEINHAFIPFKEGDLFPKDTLALYKEALRLRNRVSKKGFTGKEFTNWSMVPDIIPNKAICSGYLGWVPPFTFPIDIENAIYNSSSSDISMPIRSNLGYHIVQILNKRNTKGAYELEQVVFPFGHMPPTKHEIDSVSTVANDIYKTVSENPLGYNDLCQAYNKAHDQSNMTDCSIGSYTINTPFPAAILTKAFELDKIGDISQPIVTNYGVHILRLKHVESIASYVSIKRLLIEQIKKSDRNILFSRTWRDEQYRKFDVKIEEQALSEIKRDTEHNFPLDSLFIERLKTKNEELFSINNDIKYTTKDFAEHLAYEALLKEKGQEDGFQTSYMPLDKERLSTDVLNINFDDFVALAVRHYSDSTLEIRNPELGKQLETFTQGTLLFEVKKKNVWDIAQKDIEGQKLYFEKNKAKYKWTEPRYKGIIVHCNREQVREQIRDIAKSNQDYNELAKMIEDMFKAKKTDLFVEQGVWRKEENKYIEQFLKKTNTVESKKKFPYVEVFVKRIDAPEEYLDVKGYVEADYQDLVNKNWNQQLREKYKVEINQSVLNTLK